MKITKQKTQSFFNEKRPYEKPILHVLSRFSQTYGKDVLSAFETAPTNAPNNTSFGPS
jgi:hypothetical protein